MMFLMLWYDFFNVMWVLTSTQWQICLCSAEFNFLSFSFDKIGVGSLKFLRWKQFRIIFISNLFYNS